MITVIVVGVVCGVLGNAVYYGWLPSLARRLVRRHTRRLPSELAEHYGREWLAEIENNERENASKLVYAILLVFTVLDIRAAAEGRTDAVIAEAPSWPVWLFRAAKAGLWAGEGWLLRRKRPGYWLAFGFDLANGVAVGALVWLIDPSFDVLNPLNLLKLLVLALTGILSGYLLHRTADHAQARLSAAAAAASPEPRAAETTPLRLRNYPTRRGGRSKGTTT